MEKTSIHTSRFGSLEIDPGDVIRFPAGLFGLENCRDWVLLADAHNGALGWLQSTTDPSVALAVVSPRRFVPGYQARVARGDLALVSASDADETHVLAILSKNEHSLTLNLKAPLIINLARHLGRQVITNGEVSLQHELIATETAWRKSA